MMAFGVIDASGAGLIEPPTVDMDGLTYVSDTVLRATQPLLSTMRLELKFTNGTFGARAVPGLPGNQMSAWEALENYNNQGYVTLVDKASPTDFLISNSSLNVAQSAKSGGAYAILKGPPTLLQAATTAAAAKSIPTSTWVAVLIIGALTAFFVVRR